VALATYSDLQASAAEWLHRDDLTARIPDFIALAEARMARELRLRRMKTTATLNASAGLPTVALPADWLEFARLRLLAPDLALHYLGSQAATEYRASDTGAPRRYAIEGASLVLYPTPDAAYSIEAVYYARLAALSATPTNWLLSEAPGLYLFGALVESAPYIGDDARISLWEGRYQAEAENVRATDARAAASGSALRVRGR